MCGCEWYMKTCLQPYGWWIWYDLTLPRRATSAVYFCLHVVQHISQRVFSHSTPTHVTHLMIYNKNTQWCNNDAITAQNLRLLFFNCTFSRNSYHSFIFSRNSYQYSSKYNDILRLNSKYWYLCICTKIAYKRWNFSNSTLIVGKQILNLKQKGKESKISMHSFLHCFSPNKQRKSDLINLI